MNIRNDNNDNKELWMCNKYLSMILTDNKYLYYSQTDKKIENEKEYDIDDISIITSLDSLEEAIGNNRIIFSTKEEIIDLISIFNNIDKKNNNNNNIQLNMSYFLTGVMPIIFKKLKNLIKLRHFQLI